MYCQGMTDICLCCDEARAEYMFTWQEPDEHRKDQLALTAKVALPLVVIATGVAVFNYFVWKKG